jgi:arylsulfatase A-like enzyme
MMNAEGSSSGATARPNILVVVLDCMRAEDFPGGLHPVDGMPFATALMQESVRFPKAVSPAPWTIPSHAALFTGMYPWESRVHAFQSLGLPEGIPTLAERLDSLGYRSLSLAANAFIGPRFGLIRGFDSAAWGGWWEAFLRSPRARAPNHSANGSIRTDQSADRRMEWVRDGPMGKLLRKASQQSFRFPYALDYGSRLLQAVRDPSHPRGLSHAPWIEPELERWLGTQPADSPLFVFVNLMDMHEPYYPDLRAVHGVGEWWRLTRVRQDHNSVKGGRWSPSESDTDSLRILYRQMVRNLDARLQGIVEAFRSSGRWANTLAIVTSDHGQALGEHGTMFHSSRLDEPLVRIPLWMRPPGGTVGRDGVGWASLIDIVPTVVAAAGGRVENLPSAIPLADLIGAERPGPVYSMADGLVWDHVRRKFSKAREMEWDRPIVAGYLGDIKVLQTGSADAPRAFNVRQDPAERTDLWPTEQDQLEPLAAQVRLVAQRLMNGDGINPELEDRLRSWGYV